MIHSLELKNSFYIPYSPCCLMTEKQLREYIIFLESKVKLSDNFIEKVEQNIQEANYYLENQKFLSEQDLEVKRVNAKIDLKRDIFITLEISPAFSFPCRMYLTNEDYNFGKGHAYIVFKNSDFDSFEENQGYVLEVSQNIYNRIYLYLKNSQIPLLYDNHGYTTLDGVTKTLFVLDKYKFTWDFSTLNVEPLDRLSIFLSDFCYENIEEIRVFYGE